MGQVHRIMKELAAKVWLTKYYALPGEREGGTEHRDTAYYVDILALKKIQRIKDAMIKCLTCILTTITKCCVFKNQAQQGWLHICVFLVRRKKTERLSFDEVHWQVVKKICALCNHTVSQSLKMVSMMAKCWIGHLKPESAWFMAGFLLNPRGTIPSTSMNSTVAVASFHAKFMTCWGNRF